MSDINELALSPEFEPGQAALRATIGTAGIRAHPFPHSVSIP